MPTIIKNGQIVTGDQIITGDILIKNGKITEIGTGFTKVTQEIVDATGKYILPGGVDASVHFQEEAYNTTTADDFESGTIAAAAGGTTTVLVYAFSQKSYFKRGLETWIRRADKKCAVDYGFHLVLTHYNDRSLNEISHIVKEGTNSFICFFTGRSMGINEGQLYAILRRVAAEKGIVGIHAGNGSVTDILEHSHIQSGSRGPKAHAECRPPEVEGFAVNSALTLAEMAQAPLFVRHISAVHALEKLKIFRDRGNTVFGETCPHYLFLDESRLDDADFETARFVCSPPLRPAWHPCGLWRGIASGDIRMVSSNHMPFNFDNQKSHGKRDFRKIPSGLPGVEHRLLLMYGLGVVPGKISLTRMVRLVAADPARLFGMYPQKGTITLGSDADLVILNPQGKTKIQRSSQYQKVDYTPYEGLELPGVIERVFLRGKQVVKEGKYIGQAGDGRLIQRGNPLLD
ncbi:MAG: dihydropyrimidinase [Acidobacteria bacterium]|nr:dihydropyrimidinase [Acidobacteriota bacterium]